MISDISYQNCIWILIQSKSWSMKLNKNNFVFPKRFMLVLVGSYVTFEKLQTEFLPWEEDGLYVLLAILLGLRNLNLCCQHLVFQLSCSCCCTLFGFVMCSILPSLLWLVLGSVGFHNMKWKLSSPFFQLIDSLQNPLCFRMMHL